jgi:hypothetical protein
MLLAMAALLACESSVYADDALGSAQDTSGWKFSVSPYLWAAGISGKSGTLPGLPPANVDESFSDIWDDLKFAGMIAGSARKGRFSIAGDVQYVETQAESSSLAPFFNSETLTSEMFILSALGEYIILEKGRSNFRLSAGARLWSVDTKLELASGTLNGLTINGDDTWVDPVVGVRGSVDLSEDVFLSGWGMVGGFDVGSRIMADVFGGVGYRFTDSISTTVGYRWMKVDRDEGGFLYDVEQQGIIAGLTFTF